MQHPQQSAWAGPPSAPFVPDHAYAVAQPGFSAVAGYEFTPEQNAIIGRTATRMQGAAIISVILGALQVIGGSVMIARSIAGDTPVIPALVTVIVGIFFIRGASRLRAVVKTEGDDVAHLMGALQSIGTAFLIQLVMAILGFVMVALVAGLGISGAF